MSDENSPVTAETAAKTETAKTVPASAERNAQTTNTPLKTIETTKEEDLEDEEYEVEYVYEDEDEEISEEVIEVDEESDPTERQQETLPLDDEEDDVVEVYDEYDEDEEAVDDAEFDRIANRIDELLSKTSTLQAHTTPTLSAAALSSEPMSEDEEEEEGDLEEEVEAAPAVSVETTQPTIAEKPSIPVETEKTTETVVETNKQPQPAETISSPTETSQKEKEEVEVVDDKEYEVEYVDEEEEEEEVVKEIIEDDEKPQSPPIKKASPPIERSSTVEDSSNSSLPGQLRHVNNQWNISDLQDEEMLDTSKSDNEELNRDETMTPVGDNLEAIKEEEDIAEVPASTSKEAFFEQSEPREMPRSVVNRLGHQSLSEAMADEDEVNEIEIALEDWKEGDLEGVPEEEEDEIEAEEEDENDEVDPVMPDNLLLHANDQALHWAAAENHEEVVATLLDHNADVLLETRDGVTAGELAAIRKNKYIAEALQDFEQSELKILAETAMESTVQTVVNQNETKSKTVEPENNENVASSQSATEKTPDQKQEIKRNLSEEEIESRKEEAREIVINAIDAALARDIGKLMSRPANSAPENELRKRPVVFPEIDENDVVATLAQNDNTPQTSENTVNQAEVNAHNIVMSIAVAAAIFFFFKLMWYFSS
ncbi:PREDICTED: myb-like protein X [Rhagoletis zephyria]|uniref:myb-like protein X n=1 Tax=Rhagoletis zephyria TaxID=28612 RepID=UPI0008112B58|nr:PREDICTED: myb-like protein X [Rhagoletis zephyria]